jgi:hypothetical protein
MAEQKLERLDAIFRQSIRARDKRTNGERVSRRDFGFDFSSAKGHFSERGQVLSPSAPRAKVCYRGHSGKLMLVTSFS